MHQLKIYALTLVYPGFLGTLRPGGGGGFAPWEIDVPVITVPDLWNGCL